LKETDQTVKGRERVSKEVNETRFVREEETKQKINCWGPMKFFKTTQII
jgi:hypothetical protein